MFAVAHSPVNGIPQENLFKTHRGYRKCSCNHANEMRATVESCSKKIESAYSFRKNRKRALYPSFVRCRGVHKWRVLSFKLLKLLPLFVLQLTNKAKSLTRCITGNREDAEDAMQEAFLKAYLHLQDFHGDSRFCTWLVRIAANEALMRLRKRRPNQFSLDA